MYCVKEGDVNLETEHMAVINGPINRIVRQEENMIYRLWFHTRHRLWATIAEVNCSAVCLSLCKWGWMLCEVYDWAGNNWNYGYYPYWFASNQRRSVEFKISWNQVDTKYSRHWNILSCNVYHLCLLCFTNEKYSCSSYRYLDLNS